MCFMLVQVYPHPDGLLVLPGWRRHLLLLPGPRVAPPKCPPHHEAKEQGEHRWSGLTMYLLKGVSQTSRHAVFPPAETGT